jgi:methyltransferase
MNDFLPFLGLIGFTVLQRIVELGIAKSNEKWMKQEGAIEFGVVHYRYLVLMHMLFFVSLVSEKVFFNRQLSQVWPLLLFGFILVQLIRIWVLATLGKYWNTKIIVLAGANVITKGPYRFIKHPNYFVVAIELVIIPLLFNAYLTASLFTILNVIMLMIRIPVEEKALKELTEYAGTFQACNRFLPKIVK